MKILPVATPLLSFALVCVACQTEAASTSTFALQTHAKMTGADTTTALQGWAGSRYYQHGLRTNQFLQISCKGLPTNQVYHLMASVGTNGELMHVSDFMPNRSGAILMQYIGGVPHHFAGTNNPGQAWGMMGGWTNHMSWVLSPGSGTNWCDMMDGQTDAPQVAATMGMGDGSGMGMGGQNGGPGGMGGGMGGMGQMAGDGWPAMPNWRMRMTNWWSTMEDWCWDYTNMWNAGFHHGGGSTNWWGSLTRNAYHMMPLPGVVKMLPEINALVIMDQNLQPVLSADLANPDSFAYRVQCTLRNEGILPGAAGALHASATTRTSHFALSATGLVPSTTYYMAVNETNVTPVATDRHGRLQIRRLPDGVPGMRGIASVSIQDHNYSTILSAALPPN